MVVTASIDIAVPPAVVRAKFLDFDSLPKYHTEFFRSITPLGPNKVPSPGTKARVEFSAAGQKMDANILENNPDEFKWGGSIPLLFSGNHSFRFEPSTSIPSGTKFTQEEVFGGALGFLMGENVVARQLGFVEKTVKGWNGYNRDLKKWCEES
ncbi:hypothetical protein EJ02DRAFT_364699 [Clathrospora elynae]|uniref:Polyketide cyclase/dehydrase n=1 Tax=Clathrospora elynae TaxID=706981 RepID=A0A6A5T8L4_9PLEO|nr:hypothetical protein EJ02DRAFT_364699 [Clathrospora elynae]